MAIPANRLRRPWRIGMPATNSQCAIRYGILRRRSHVRLRRPVPVGDSVFGLLALLGGIGARADGANILSAQTK